MLLVCCWRTIKEISFLFSRLGEISIKFILDADHYRYITLDQIRLICQYFMEQLLKSRHCGAYELAYTGFVKICQQLWRSVLSGWSPSTRSLQFEVSGVVSVAHSVDRRWHRDGRREHLGQEEVVFDPSLGWVAFLSAIDSDR